MTPQTLTGWILFAALWLSGPITGYAALNLAAARWERESMKRRDVLAASILAPLLLVSALLLMFVDGL